jgi:hypothetical protein
VSAYVDKQRRDIEKRLSYLRSLVGEHRRLEQALAPAAVSLSGDRGGNTRLTRAGTVR